MVPTRRRHATPYATKFHTRSTCQTIAILRSLQTSCYSVQEERLGRSFCVYPACIGVPKGQETWTFNARLGKHLCTAQRTRRDITNVFQQNPPTRRCVLPRSLISLRPAVDQETKDESHALICPEMRRDFVCAGSTSRFGRSARPFRIAAFDKRSLSTR